MKGLNTSYITRLYISMPTGKPLTRLWLPTMLHDSEKKWKILSLKIKAVVEIKRVKILCMQNQRIITSACMHIRNTLDVRDKGVKMKRDVMITRPHLDDPQASHSLIWTHLRTIHHLLVWMLLLKSQTTDIKDFWVKLGLNLSNLKRLTVYIFHQYSVVCKTSGVKTVKQSVQTTAIKLVGYKVHDRRNTWNRFRSQKCGDMTLQHHRIFPDWIYFINAEQTSAFFNFYSTPCLCLVEKIPNYWEKNDRTTGNTLSSDS